MMNGSETVDALHETAYWHAQPDIRSVIAAGNREYANRETVSLQTLREELGVPD